ncbi:MAG: alcohol dehydrogenase catalytic domain-containing protein [Clostridia bacterium]|nr:alcohol dehydrogenase catalytic domain-containing protein [Clostridia bacterium]
MAVPGKMKAIVMDGINQMSLKEFPIPALEANQVLIRIAYCGICATDYDNYSGISSFTKEGKIRFPLRWGHEWSGRVCAVGAGVQGIKLGDRVISSGKITCGKCSECLSGREYNCLNRRTVGTVGDAWPGGMSEYAVMPARDILKMGEKITYQEAAAIEAASIAMNGLRGLPLKGATLLITGSGPIGLSGIPIGRWMGAKKIIIAARKEAKLDIARAMGADHVINTTQADLYEEMKRITSGALADVVLETSGEASFVENMAQLLRPQGDFSTISFYTRRINNFNMDDVVFNKINIYGRCGSYNCSETLLELIDEGQIDIKPIITSVIDFYEWGANCMDCYTAEKNRGSKMLVKVFGEEA